MSYKLESRLLGEINSLIYEDDTTLMAESKEEIKSFLMRVKEESEKSDLNLKIKKTKIIASGLITTWQREGGKGWSSDISSSWALKSLQMVTAAMKLQDNYFLAGKLWQI